jgi:hypothetical protein
MLPSDASRFLAQSQTRPSAGQQQDSSPTRSTNGRHHSNSRLGTRSFLKPSTMSSPYHQGPSTTSRFPFSSRTPAPQAPLFYNAADEFREEDDGEEHQREVADFYALQRSRRAFGPSNLTESSEGDGDYVERSSELDDTLESHDTEEETPFGRPRGQGIKSSWRGERDGTRGRKGTAPAEASVAAIPERGQSVPESEASTQNRSGKGKLVDVALTQSEHSSIENLQEDDDYGPEDSAPAYSGFHFKAKAEKPTADEQSWVPESEDETARLYNRPRSIDGDSVLPGIEEEEEEAMIETTRHDAFWATFYFISFASLFASAFLVYLHTDTPSSKNPLGDTIYTVLRRSFHLLAVDTLVAIIVAAFWLALLRTYLRPLTYLTILAVPIIFFAFALWPFITSFSGNWHGKGSQDKVMRIFSAVPFLGALMWTYMVAQSRHSIDRSIRILELASKILSASPSLVMAGGVTLAATVVWFWVWLAMFTRVFLEGHFAKKLFVIDVTTWWLGIFFFLMLLWTQLVISGVQRATTAATVSQWYFYRNSDTGSTSSEVVLASFKHATGPLFGTICLSTLMSLLIRLPLIVLPRRIAGFCSLCIYAIVPAPVMSITTPLTLTYAAIHSQPLAVAARGVSRLPLSASNTPSRSFRGTSQDSDPLSAYRTTHMLLHATRQIMTLALGLGAWMSTARYIQLSGAGYAGSMYAYVVGLGAAAVGWAVLGAVEGIVGGVVDGVLICWGSEMAAGRQGRRFCPEAGELFGSPIDRGERIMV